MYLSPYSFNANGVDQQLGPDPCPHARLATHPGRQRPQAAAKATGIAETPLDGRPCPVQRLAKLSLLQGYTPQAVKALVMLAAARLLAGANRRYQLIAPRRRRIVQVAGIVVAIA